MTVSIDLNNLANLQNETTAVNTINDNNNSIETAFASALNTSGDVMQGNLDMNSQQILNLPAPVSNYDPIRLIDVTTINDNGITVSPLPSGGIVSQVLTKNSSTNFDTSWQSPLSIPVSGSTGQVLAKNSNVTGDYSWSSTPSLNSVSTGTGVLTFPTNTTDTLIGASTPATLTNKNIDGGSNVLTNVPVTALNSGTAATSSSFWRGDGVWAAAPTGTYIFLEQLTANNSSVLNSSVSWSGYGSIAIELLNILPVTGANTCILRVHANGLYQTSNYAGITYVPNGTSISVNQNFTYVPLCNTNSLSSTYGMGGSVKLSNPASTSQHFITGLTTYGVSNISYAPATIGCVWQGAFAVDGLQISLISGNIASGVVRIYGIV